VDICVGSFGDQFEGTMEVFMIIHRLYHLKDTDIAKLSNRRYLKK